MDNKHYHNTGCQDDNTMCRYGAQNLAEKLINAIETRAQSGIGSDTTGIPKLTREYLATTLTIAMQFVPGMVDTIKNQTTYHLESKLDDITFVPSTSEIEKAK